MPFSPLRDLPDPGIEPASPTLAAGFFTTVPPTKPRQMCKTCKRYKCASFLISHTQNDFQIVQRIKCSKKKKKKKKGQNPQNRKQEGNIYEILYAIGLRKQSQGIKSKIDTTGKRLISSVA